MKEVLIRFENREIEGIVAVGTYLMDAAKRLGVDVNDECRTDGTEHRCSMKISAGSALLSEPTSVETEFLSKKALEAGERLSCQTRIDQPGEISIMSVEKTKEAASEKTDEQKPEEEFKKEFESMPLDKKFAALVELEAIALGETFSYVLNSPYEAAGKVMDVLADFGWKKDKADQEAKKPEEHSEEKKKEPSGKAGKAASGKAKSKAKKSGEKKSQA